MKSINLFYYAAHLALPVFTKWLLMLDT